MCYQAIILVHLKMTRENTRSQYEIIFVFLYMNFFVFLYMNLILSSGCPSLCFIQNAMGFQWTKLYFHTF